MTRRTVWWKQFLVAAVCSALASLLIVAVGPGFSKSENAGDESNGQSTTEAAAPEARTPLADQLRTNVAEEARRRPAEAPGAPAVERSGAPATADAALEQATAFLIRKAREAALADPERAARETQPLIADFDPEIVVGNDPPWVQVWSADGASLWIASPANALPSVSCSAKPTTTASLAVACGKIG